MFRRLRRKILFIGTSFGLSLCGIIILLTYISNWQLPASAHPQVSAGNYEGGIFLEQHVEPAPLQAGSIATYSLAIGNHYSFTIPALVTNTLPGQVAPGGQHSWDLLLMYETTWTHDLPVTANPDYEGAILNELQVTVPTARAENLSYCTTCAEEDNINIPLYGVGVSHYEVIATHPAYDYGDDNCDADFSGCDVATLQARGLLNCPPAIYDDGVNVITVCTETDWWLPNIMTVTVGSETVTGHRLVWNNKVLGVDSWPEVLVMYQDGNMRLKPHPDFGRDDVCFGSSVIIGPAPRDDERPYVEIEQILVDPVAMTMELVYRNGGSAQLSLTVDRVQATLEVLADYDSQDSFATFRSMYVAEDNSDAARVATAVGDYALLNVPSSSWTPAWPILSGPEWFFYREEVSNHNTSAPDILVRALDGEVTYVSTLTSCVGACRSYLPLVPIP